jgi:hypothetical protein
MKNVIHVKVTNGNKNTIEDRYDGILYQFKPGVAVSVPYEAACHIFGVDFAPDENGVVDENLREQMFLHLGRRWGWNRTLEAEKNRNSFDRLEFSLTHMKLVEEESNVTLPPPHQIGNKGGRPRREA